MQRSRRNSIFTQPTGALGCGGCESTMLTSSQRPRRFRTAGRNDFKYSGTATITQYIGYDGCAMTGTTGTAACARYDSRDGTIETIGRAEGQPVNTAYDSLTRESNNSMATLGNSADESTAEYCHGVPQEFSQTFTYDPLNRLTANTLGGAANQSWTLDSQGNWSSVTTNGTTQTRTANAQNQITSVSGSTTPTYDANGNMTTDRDGNTYTYNAWNQLVAVTNSAGQLIAQYSYDARGYRISETYPQGGTGIPAGEINYIYYDSSWQAIETRINGTAASDVTSQMVWSASYINAAVLQDTYSAGVIQPNSRLYFEQDANWNATAVVGLVSGNWQVVQRYAYSPYGTITVLNADWSTPSAGTSPLVNNLYQGMTLDSVTGLYYERYRNYSPSLGTWTSQDPLQYINGANTYQFVMSNPVRYADPQGTDVILLTSPGEADGHGHAAVLVGNSGSGWTYYSKNAPGNGSPSGNTQQWYPNLNAFWNAQSKAEHNKMNHAQRYPNEMRIPECKGRTAAMNEEAKAIVNEPYSVLWDNCADLAQQVLQAGAIPTGETGPFFGGYVGPSIPNYLWENLGNEWANGQLPAGSTLIFPTTSGLGGGGGTPPIDYIPHGGPLLITTGP